MTTKRHVSLGPWNGEQTPRYGRDRKALDKGILNALNDVQAQILQDPYRGDQKHGGLRMVRVGKFKAQNDQWLVAYVIFEKTRTVRFLAVGQRENFYRDLHRHLRSRPAAAKDAR